MMTACTKIRQDGFVKVQLLERVLDRKCGNVCVFIEFPTGHAHLRSSAGLMRNSDAYSADG